MRIAGIVTRFGAAGALVTVAVLVAVQYENIVARNVAMMRQVDAAQTEIRSLEVKVRKEQREVRRLSDPRGAIPEIHDRLKAVARGEELIFVRAQPTAVPAEGTP